jgi:hypothetical protein
VNIKFGTKFIIALCDAFWKIAQTGRFYFEKCQMPKRPIRKRRKKWGLSFKKIGNIAIPQKPMTSFKQVACHRIAFFKIT